MKRSSVGILMVLTFVVASSSVCPSHGDLHVSFSTSMHAWRRAWSIMVLFTVQLLEHEILVGDQVQMLLEMEETNKALDKAIQSGDAQLGTQEERESE